MSEGKKILIVYERKNRELETAILLKRKLVSIGYCCKVTQFYWGFDFNLFSGSVDILIVPHLYGDLSVSRLIARYGRPKIIINLQYEQVLSEKWEKLGHHNPSGEAKKAIHVCWGKATFNRLKEFGILDKNLLMIGAPHLDLLNAITGRVFEDQKVLLAKEFELDSQSEWVLFLSSFTYADIAEHRLKMNEEVAGSTLGDFVDIHTKSRNEILNWLEDSVAQNPDKLFIYRPHPDELSLERVKVLADRFKNFRIIASGSAKQWIISSDSILSWYSTTVVESHYLGKNYQILRPFVLPDYFDSVLLKKADFLSEKVDFLDYVNGRGSSRGLPLKNAYIEAYYDNIDGSMASDRLVSYIEEVAKNNDIHSFGVSFNSLFRAKLISFSVLVVFLIYRCHKNLSFFEYVRKIKFFDRWFSEFDNQFVDQLEVSSVESNISFLDKRC